MFTSNHILTLARTGFEMLLFRLTIGSYAIVWSGTIASITQTYFLNAKSVNERV